MSDITTTRWENTLRVLQEYGEKVKAQYQSNLEKNRHVASGRLHDNIEVVVIDEPDRLEVALNLEEWWKWVEDGRNAGKQPPIEAIKRWIEVKLNAPNIDQLSYLIARKIGQKGYPAVGHPFQNAVDSTSMDLETALEEAIMMDLSVDVDTAISLIQF